MNGNLIWLGILPIILFAILDSRTSKKGSIVSAFIAAIIEVVFSIFYSKSGVDYLTAMVIIILAISVLISLKKDDTFYFKISGSINWIIFSVMMLFSAFVLDIPMLTSMAEKYIGFDEIAKNTPNINVTLFKAMLDKLSVSLPFFIILHSSLTIYAAKKWTTWAWLFIRISNPYVEMLILSFYYGLVLK